MASQNAAKESPHLIDEADVGSGEKSPGQRETDAMVEQIGEQPPAAGAPGNSPATEVPQTRPETMPRAGAT